MIQSQNINGISSFIQLQYIELFSLESKRKKLHPQKKKPQQCHIYEYCIINSKLELIIILELAS